MSYRVPATSPLSAWLREIWDRRRGGHGLARAAAGLGALSPLMALANPTGGQVVGGQANISVPSANSTLIKQTSQNAVINWQQFSVGANQYVQFLQPDSSAVVLNRVIGGNPSSIFGDIKANGQVFLINPNGILFGRGATLDVSGLVASTQNIGNADFMAGRYNFLKGSGAPDASVINQGAITTTPNGYVVLAGDYVENDGVIQAQSGRVLLAAGGATTLTLDQTQGLISYTVNSATLARLAGVSNTGSIVADGGTVVMTADVANALTATAVNNSGFIAAHSIISRDGVIVLTAKGGDIDNSGTLDASATQMGVAGGTVILRGNGETKLTPTSAIDASGDGAKGGFVELSGHTLHIGGQVDVGHGGSLLIDPAKLFITAGSSAGGSITSGDYVGELFIDSQLLANNNVVLVASNSIAAGNPGGVASGPATAITVPAGTGNLTIKTGTLTLHSGAGTGTLMGFAPNHCGQGVCTPKSGSPGVFYAFTPTSGTINFTGITINIKGALTVNAQQGTVTLSGVTANGVSVTAGTVNLNGSVNARTGNLMVSATRTGPASPAKITVAGGKTLTGKSVNLLASASYGGIISAGAITATGGSMVVNAIGKVGTFAGNNNFKATLGNLTATGAVQVLGQGSAGSVTVGSINAKGVTLNAAASAKNAQVTTGKIVSTGGVFNVNVSETGPSGSLNVGSISAAGAGVIVTAGNVGGGNITLGNVTNSKYVKVSTNAGGVINVNNIVAAGVIGGTGASKSDAVVINDTGPVNGNVVQSVAGTLVTTSGNVKITAGHVTLGTVSDGGTLKVTATETGPVAASFSAKGAIVAKAVNATASASYGGKISTAAVTATGGSINMSAKQTSANNGSAVISAGNMTGRAVNLLATGRNRKITTGAVTATGTASTATVHDYVHMTLASSAAAVSGITIGGQVKSSHGSVAIVAPLAPVTLGASSASRPAIIGHTFVRVRGSNLHLGSVSVAAGGLSVYAHAAAPSPANITVAAGKLLKATNVSLTASASHGATVTVGNAQAFSNSIRLNAFAAAATHSGSIVAGNLTAARGVNINVRGGAVKGGDLTVGNISAGKYVSISASHLGVTPGFTVQTGSITGKHINITATGAGGQIKTLGLTANGSLHSCIGECGAGGYIKAKIIQPAPNSNASINVTGPVKSTLSYVSMSGGVGAVNVIGAVDAGKSIKMSATTINVAALTAASAVSLAGVQSALTPTKITASGLVKGQSVKATISLTNTATQSGSIHLAGGASATGLGVGSMVIRDSASAAVKTKINTGHLQTALRQISLNQKGGNGSVSVAGGISAGSSGVNINANDTGLGGNVIIGGNVNGGRVRITTHGIGGADINVTGGIHTTACCSLSLSANAGPGLAGGNVTVAGPMTTTSGRIRIHTSGGGSAGGRINVGAMSARSSVSINANYHGTAAGFTAKTGAINAHGKIKVAMAGKAPHFSAAGITAVASCECGSNGVSVVLTPSVASGSSGVINITGPVISSQDGLTLNPGHGSVIAGPVTENALRGHKGNITINGSVINVGGAIIDASDDVTLTGNSVAAHSTGITVIGPITAHKLAVTVGSSANGGAIHLGAVSATGLVVSHEGISLTAVTSGAKKMQITAGALKAAAGNITLNQGGASGSVTVAGLTSAAAGNVVINTKGTGGINVGSIHAGLGATLHAAGRSSGSNKGITVNGGITAGKIRLTTNGFGGGNITVHGNLTANTGNVVVNASGSSRSGGNLSISGKVTATVGGVQLVTFGGGSSGGNLKVLGGISAAKGASIGASHSGASGSGFIVKAGAIKGASVNISMHGRAPHFSGASLTAVGAVSSAGAHDYVHVTLTPTGANKSSGAIALTGPVKSSHGTITLNPSHGSISIGGAVTAKTGNININGGRIHVNSGAAITASSGDVIITGNPRAAQSTNIFVGAPITGEKVTVAVNLPASDAHPGTINLRSVTATGLTSPNDGISINAVTAAPQPMNFNNEGNFLKAVGGNITVTTKGNGGFVGLGAAMASAGGITVNATGAATVSIGGELGNVHAVKAVNVSVTGGTSGDNLRVLGNATGSSIRLNAQASIGGNVSVGGNLTATALGVHVTANATGAGGNIVIGGNVVASGGGVSFGANGGGAAGGNINLNNINNTGSGVNINARYTGPSTGFHVKTGTINGGFIAVNMDGKDPLFSAAGLTGKGHTCECSANVFVLLENASFAAAPGGSIHITGPVTAANGGVKLNAGFGVVSMGGNSISAAGSVGRVRVEGGQLHLGSVKAAGNVSISVFGVTSHGASITTAPTDTITGTRVSINLANSSGSNGAKLAIGAVHATGAGTSANSGHINITDTSFSTQKVSVTTGALTATKAISVLITDASGSMSLGKLSAPSVKVSLATGNMTVGGISGAATGASINAAGSLTVAGAGNVILNGGIFKAGKAIHVNAGGDLTLDNVSLTDSAFVASAGGNLTYSAAGSLALAGKTLAAGKLLQLKVGKDLLLANGNLHAATISASAGGNVSNGGIAGNISDTGGITIKAKGSIVLTGETLHVGSGKAMLSAAGGIAMTGADISAGSLNEVTAGSIDLTGAIANVGGTLQLIADKDIILSRVNINAGIFLAAASGSIHNGGGPGTITANAINVASKQSINFSSTDITLGSGALPSFAGDTQLLAELAGFSIGPTSSTLNGAFLADGSLTLGGLTITGHYLALQGSSVAILGKVSAPASGLLVQVIPFDPTAAVGVEGASATTQAFNLSNQGFIALFPGATIAIGDDVESGSVFIGANGAFTLADKTNLFFDTTGPVTGLDLLTTTGLVTTLEVFVAAVGTDVVTVGEIDPNAGSTTNTGLGDQTDKKKLGQPSGGTGTGQQGGTISSDTSGTGVCH